MCLEARAGEEAIYLGERKMRNWGKGKKRKRATPQVPSDNSFPRDMLGNTCHLSHEALHEKFCLAGLGHIEGGNIPVASAWLCLGAIVESSLV